MADYPNPYADDRWLDRRSVDPVHFDTTSEPHDESLPAPDETPVPERPPHEHRLGPHIAFYLLTCLTTFLAYATFFHGTFRECLIYAGAVMLLLTAHEAGHYIQAVRHGVPRSLPYFIPWPFGYLGTMGAVIRMRGEIGNRVALFDIGITGPLAGLVPSLIFTVIGIHYSHVAPLPPNIQPGIVQQFGDPLLIKFLVHVMKGPVPPGADIILNHCCSPVGPASC